MATIITSTASFVQASGIENLAKVVQASGAVNENSLVSFDLPESSTTVTAAGGITNKNGVIQFSGVSQTGDIVNPSGIETTATAKINVFFPDFSRSAFLAAVVGTTGTIEKFFDRSPFYFDPHETDPNTLRDISEAQQFLVFSTANITSYENFRRIPSSAFVISTKGDELSDRLQSPQDLITNGGFETGDFSSWEVSVPSGVATNVVEVRTDSPGLGFGLPTGVFPEEGTYWARLANDNTGTAYIKQTLRLGQTQPSTILKNLSFQALIESATNTLFQGQLSLVFLENDDVKFHLRYTLGSHAPVSMLPDDFPGDTFATSLSLSHTVNQLNSYLRNLQQDMSFSTFEFKTIELWFMVSSGNSTSVDYLLDDFQLTIDLPPPELLRTRDLAHILTGHPTASGFPFTISGSDDINQVDLTGPFFDETSPASGTTFNDPDQQVQFHIKDGGSALDQGTIDVWIDGLQVVSAGTTVTGALWPIASKTVLASNNIEYIFTRANPFEQQATVTVSGEMADLAAVSNQTITEYDFTILGSGSLDATISGAPDGTPPVIIPTEPVGLDTQISPNTQILWSTTDDASGVDPSTVKLLLNGATKLENDVAVVGSFSRIANTSRGFDYTYTPNAPFTFGETVTGTIIAGDSAGNSDSLSYSFTITPDDTLSITNFFLNEGESTLISSGTAISVCVEDAVHGVSVSGSSFTVNGLVPSGLNVTTSGAGPDKVTYSVLVDEVNDFRDDLEIFVHAENNFPGPYPVIKEQTFVLRPGYEVVWTNREDGGADVVFPYITNIQVLAEVKNFAKNFNTGSLFTRFLTQSQVFADLGATLESNIKVADLSATIESNNPFFEYGKTFTLTIEVDDLEGNQLRFEHTFTIEQEPM